MKVTNGVLLCGIGGVHQLFGLAAGLGFIALPGASPRNLLADIARDGVVGAVAHDPLRVGLFWFLFFGFLLILLGALLHTLEQAGQRLPGAVGWQIGLLALAGGLLIPASGFWLVLPVAWRLIRHADQRRVVEPVATTTV